MLINFQFGKVVGGEPIKNVKMPSCFILARRASVLYLLMTFCLKPLCFVRSIQKRMKQNEVLNIF